MKSAPLPAMLSQATAYDVDCALDCESLNDAQIATLLSRAATPYLEAIACRASNLTRQRFGRTTQLFAPLYVSNECVNRCSYCGFSQELSIRRRTLSVPAVITEAERLYAEGFRHLLIVSGEIPRIINLEYLEAVATALRQRFDSLSIEVGSFDLAGYQRLAAAGIDGLTLYQETYLPDIYRRVHIAGPKARFEKRLQVMQYAGQAGFRVLGIGALLGLGPWQHEAFHLAMHGRSLTRQFWKSRIAVSFPRIRENAGGQGVPYPVTDRDLVQMICVMRLALPDAELVLSTRETASLRDDLMGLCITRMSAGSRTNPGGYSDSEGAGEQFSISDQRSASEVSLALCQRGLEPVWKDFDRGFLPPNSPERSA